MENEFHDRTQDRQFWIEVRRGLLCIAKALVVRYGWSGLLWILGDK